jgi:cytosine/uracil/thiamine/allantoin permease
MNGFQQMDEPFVPYGGKEQSGKGIATSESISMSHTDTFTLNFPDNKRFTDNFQAYLIPQIVGKPVIMIAGKKIDLYSSIAQSCQLT